MTRVAVRVTGLGKRYALQGQAEYYRTLRDSIADATRRVLSGRLRREAAERGSFWALKDLDFTINHGESVGIIGHNGAGKSTLLKVLSRITEPTEGMAEVHGRVGSLLEVGTGFHAELSGRENIFMSGAILGMPRSEITRKFDEIVEFAEVARFVDTPVKHYSSGMYLRLAFAVAAHLEPDVLIVDEVLAVGDAAFQQRCISKMDSIAAGGRTVLFVSHNLSAVKELCTKGIVLKGGRVAYAGGVVEALAAYSRGVGEAMDATDRAGWRGLSVNGAPGELPVTLQAGEALRVQGTVSVPEELSGVRCYLLLKSATGELLVRAEHAMGSIPAATGATIDVQLPPLWLATGVYTLYLKLTGRTASGRNADHLSPPMVVDSAAQTNGRYRAVLTPRAEWSVAMPETPELVTIS